MLQYFQDFIYTIIGNGTFSYIETEFVVDIMSLCLVSLTFFLIVKLVLNIFKFFGGLAK